MLHRSLFRALPLVNIKNTAKFNELKRSTLTPLLVGLFYSKQSLAVPMFKQDFSKLAEQNSSLQFFTCEITSETAQAAYDCEVENDWTVVLYPLGFKHDGTLSDKTDLVKADALRGDYSTVIFPKAADLIKNSEITGSLSKGREFSFDPATGTELMKEQLY
jgi:hypothetical protein